jgi:site-specific DNA-cytosine methylase
MRVLIGCECSGRVRDAFAARGHETWSCDLKASAGNHIEGDILEQIDREWDLMIAHPPCTHLSCSGAAWFREKKRDGRQQFAVGFFMMLASAPIRRICLENPVGIMSTIWRKPDQVIQPYHFGDEFQKTTCLWLKNLPRLTHSDESDWFTEKTHVGKGEMVTYASGKVMPKWYAELRGNGERRSVTFQGIAEAMADQWGKLT